MSLILALIGGGAMATGGGSRSGTGSAEPALAPSSASLAPQPAARITEPPAARGEEPAEEDREAPPPDPEEETGAQDDPAPETEAPDLPDSAYNIGWQGLTAQEQYMLELINRARLDPEAEEIRTGDVVDADVSTAPKQALAVDPILSAAADNHSADMLARDFFDHYNPDGDSPTDRARAEDWEGGGVWENISARWSPARSVSDEQAWIDASHAGLWESDGHQFGMLQPGHTVVGVGIDQGEWSYPGSTFPTAMVVTEKFANDGQTYLTGVVMDDADNDDFYDIGEGLGGVRITAWQDEEAYATSTWGSGGYSLALDAGTYNVRFEGGALDTVLETTVTIGAQNVKLDVNSDDLGIAGAEMAAQRSAVPEADPVENLFLSADASRDLIEQGADAADAQQEEDPEDAEWAMA
ncbi:CAP domain-containing protein [Roseobacter sp. S98]|uniref:CAP domain-containing protein n=1 Tax=Roseobacter algicola (ex Choi et al. 2025) (nom. illeg.) TaxID=3092138 RepID=UPI0035C6A74B